MKTSITSILLVITNIMMAQNQKALQFRSLRTDSSTIYVDLFKESKSPNIEVCSTCQYHWLKGGRIQTTKGGYQGQILHGNFTEFYLNGDLKTKGRFDKGLKNKEWRTWYIGGELMTIQEWKKGQLNGVSLFYDSSGQLIQKLNYKNGLLHGKQYYFSDSIVRMEMYKRGFKIAAPKPNGAKRRPFKTEEKKLADSEELNSLPDRIDGTKENAGRNKKNKSKVSKQKKSEKVLSNDKI